MGFNIVHTKRLNSITNLFEIEAPLIAGKIKAGQFVVLRCDERGERIPLTVAKKDTSKGIITIIFQWAGKTTKALSAMKKGDSISDIIGPLGKPTDFGKVGRVILVGGGIGTAEILPVVEYAKGQGNDITVIAGARSGEFIILEKELLKLTKDFIITTDDGTYGKKGLVTGPLKELLEKDKADLVYCVGPDVMMKAVCVVAGEHDVKTLVSLDANMIDATGMCGTCRVTVGGQIRFTCVDGPEFDGHQVDWDELLKRQKRFKDEEKRSLDLYNSKCRCK